MARKRKQETNTNQRKLITWLNSKSPVSEQYRTIRTNIQYSSVDKEMQAIVVTSAGPGEGKSTTVANLAVTMAQQEKKVLLIDGDLRKPTVHYTFRRMNTHGMINALTNQGQYAGYVQETEVPNLDILPSGPIPPNPSEILGSRSMAHLVELAREQYDVILFDAPPALAVTDVQVISRHCDGSILVVKSGSTENDAARKAKELLEVSGVPILGCILNQKKDMDKSHYYYYGQ